MSENDAGGPPNANNPFGGGPINPGGPDDPSGPQPVGQTGGYTQQFRHAPVGARVPEKLGRGVLSTGTVILDSPTEFVIDFLQGLTRPFQVVARVVMAPPTMGNFSAAVADNLAKYTKNFGPPPQLPKSDRRPTIAEVYETFRLGDEMLSGSYSNAVLIGHTAGEFFFDFITGFYPHAAVSARVLMSAPQVPRLLEATQAAIRSYQMKFQQPPPEAGNSQR